MRLASLLWLVPLAACGDDGSDGGRQVGGCDGRFVEVPGEPGLHEPAGSTIDWSTNPPATGAHYPTWAGWDRHYTELPRGNWMHNAEHGGVIVLYRCPEGCPEVVDQLLEAARGAPTDATCRAPVTRRVLVAADPDLPEGVQVAAVGWNAYYTATCVDPYLSTFIATRTRLGPEDTCADGNPFGGTLLTP